MANPIKVKYKYLNRPGPGRTFKTKKSAINFNKIRANQKVLFTVQGVTGQETFGSIGKIEAQTRKYTRSRRKCPVANVRGGPTFDPVLNVKEVVT